MVQNANICCSLLFQLFRVILSAKINIHISIRSELLFTLCYGIPCTRYPLLGETWKSIFKKANTEILSDLALAVRKSFELRKNPWKNAKLRYIESVDKFGKDATPLHVTAAYGNLKLFKLIMDLSDQSNLLMGIDNWSVAV